MIKKIGTSIKNISTKILIALIALSFAVWGIGDIFTGSSNPTIATVGKSKIKLNDFNLEYQAIIENLRRSSEEPISEEIIKTLSKYICLHINEQHKSGSDIIQVFDSWAGLLSPSDFHEFALPYIKQIIDQVKGAPSIVFAKGAWHAINEMAQMECNALGVDWALTPQKARELAGPNITLQGNFDPSWLFAPISKIERLAKEMVDRFGKDKYIANLGHGILPTVPVDNAKAFINAIKNYTA